MTDKRSTAGCPQCREPVNPGDAFCESCGATIGPADAVGTPSPGRAAAAGSGFGTGARVEGDPLEQSARTHLIAPPGADEDPAPPATPAAAAEAAGAGTAYPPCTSCGSEVGTDGWCTQCGARAGNGRDHVVEQAGPTVAVVSDIGRVHRRNEDAGAVAADGSWSALVVCDGVTSATDSDLASGAAVTSAVNVLSEAHAATRRPGASSGSDSGSGSGSDTSSGFGSDEEWYDALKDSARAADAAADAAAGGEQSDNPPSCTFVAAVACGSRLIAAWVGDSRAYWFPDDGPAEQLTTDDSWASEQIASGIPRAVAEAAPQAHAITRWLGADSPDVDARVTATTADGPGWLLLCSDGLWNYRSPAAELATLVAEHGRAEPLALAESLVEWANEQGGHDNITVAVSRIDPTGTPTGTLTGTSTGSSNGTLAGTGTRPATPTEGAP